MLGLYDAKPFTTYWYYKDAKRDNCSHCEKETMFYLMRYRVFLGIRFPIIPTGTNYYYVCSNCGWNGRINGEGAQAKIIEKLPSRKAIKYNKYSQLDFDDYLEEDMMIFGTDKELNKNIQLHIRDMKAT